MCTFFYFKSPLLLLYLDCVWQLSQQFPAEFEFTETYLTTLWDTAHVSIFDTFIFNCEKDRIAAATVILETYTILYTINMRLQEQIFFRTQVNLLFFGASGIGGNNLVNRTFYCFTILFTIFVKRTQ